MILNYLKALSVFAGTIIGVGIFGLPYVTMKAGFPVMIFYFLVITIFIIITHLLYGEIALGTEKLHRFPGYVSEYLGLRWKKITFFVNVFGLTGALLAYLIVGGKFMELFFAPYFGGSNIVYTLIFFAAGAYLVFRDIRSIAKIELSLLFLFLALLAVLFFKAVPFIDLNYFKAVDWKFFTLPYGVVIFSLWGNALVPEIKEMLGGSRNMLRLVIASGIILATIVYLLFIVTVFGVTGLATTKEAMAGFSSALGDGIVKLGFIFGVITTFTSFIALALTLKKTFWYDFGFSKNASWAISCFAPLILFFLGLREFIDIIGFVGAITLGLETTILIFLYRKFLAIKFSKKAPFFIYPLVGVLILGVIFEAIYIFFVKI